MLGGVGLAIGAGLAPAASAQTMPAAPVAAQPAARAVDGAMHRRALEVREACARMASAVPVAPHPANDDEMRYPNRIGTDTRALPHDARGEVDQAAWRALHDACHSGEPEDFEKIPLGGVRKLVNPVGTTAVSLSGLTPTQIAIPPAPALASAERAAEAVEVYWQALLRDVPLHEFQNGSDHSAVRAACEELSRLSDFRGPKAEGRVTPGTLFRGSALYFDVNDPKGRSVSPPGTLDGPMVSQFLLRDVPCGAQWLSASMRPATPASEFMAEYEEWLRIQNGEAPRGRMQFDGTPRYIATGRDMAEYVRGGTPPVAAALLLVATPAAPDARYGGLYPAAQSPVSAANPYRRSRTQMAGPASFGPPHALALLGTGLIYAVRAAYWQKYFVHRTLRPEAYGGLAHHRLVSGVSDYPVHEEFLRSEALDRCRAKYGTCLLPQCYPEGAPTHSAYPGGASAVGAVTATLLKAFFDENRVIPDPVQPDPADPTRLVAYKGPPLTVGGELNKLALNLGGGRNWAGIHWRSDAAASLPIAEEVAISMLREERATCRETFEGFSLTRFDGTRVTI
jgi:hypothetical protein